MKPKQRQKENNIIHMTIQPVRQLFGTNQHKSQTNKHTNTQGIIIDHNNNFTSHHHMTSNNNQLQQLPETHSLSQQQQSSIQPQQQPNSGNIIQKQLLIQQHLTTNYIHDHYQHILKPMAFSFTKYSILFVLIFCLVKIFWIYEDILQRKEIEQQYLRSITKRKMIELKTECQQVFVFLDQIQDLLEMKRNDNVEIITDSSSVINCDEFNNNKFKCSDSNNSIQKQFLMSIDSNYDLFALEIVSLITANINLTNVFIMNLNTLAFIQLNLTTTIIQNDLSSSTPSLIINNPHYQQSQSTTLNPNHITMFVNFINSKYNITSNNSSSNNINKQFKSYLGDSYQQPYQLYQLFLFDQLTIIQQLLTTPHEIIINNHMYDKSWNLYCINVLPTYLNTTFPSKLCVSINKQQQPQQSNILYIDSNSTKILITNSTFLTSFQDTDQTVGLYQLFSHFILEKVYNLYPQYLLSEEDMLECLRFQQGFYEDYSKQKNSNLYILRCYDTTYMHMLISEYIFAWGYLTVTALPYSNLLPIALSTSTLQICLFSLPNITYYSDIHNISTNGVSTIELTIKLYLAILTLTLFTFQLSTNLIYNIMIQSIFTIKKLAKVVLTMDDVKKADNQFNKIVQEIEQVHTLPYTPILGTIIGYLEKFLWIKKLYHINKKFSQHKFKKYNLLFQGLNLFKYLNVDAQFPEQKKSILQRFYQSKKQILSKKRISTTNKSKTKSKSQTVNSQENQQLREFVIKDNYIHHSGVLMYIYRELTYLQKEKINKFKNIQVLTKRQNFKIKSQQMNMKQDTGRKNSPFNNENTPQTPILDSKHRENLDLRFLNHRQQFKESITDRNDKKFLFKSYNSSINGNNSQQESIKSIEIEKKQQKRSSKSIGMISSSSKRTKKGQVTMRNIRQGEGLGSMKSDEQGDSQVKQQILAYNSSLIPESLHHSLARFTYTHHHVLQQTLQSYHRIIHYYQQMVDIQQSSLNYLLQSNTIPNEQMQQRANIIYGIQLKRVKIMHQYLELLVVEKVYEGQEVDFEQLGVDVGYERLAHYERVYEIDGKLVEEGKLWKMKVDIVLGKSVSYKKLQQIIDSDNTQVALHANLLYAQQLHKLKPFLDYQVINSIYTSLLLHDTSIQYKQHSLQLLIDTLLHSNPTTFTQQIQQLHSIKKYYNRRHKKFYFITDMTEAFDIFTPILTKIYDLMNQMNLMEVYNLAMNEVTEDLRLTKQIIKPQTLQVFLSLFQQLTSEKFKSKQKQKGSSKNIKKYAYEKDFNDILDEIQKDQTQYSSFIVVILGGDQVTGHLSMITDDAESSSNQRQLNQLLHSEINRKISQNYYHMISIGTHMNNFLTKQGKLKKHIKNSPDLLQIDLIKKNMTEHFSLLEKFLE